MGVILVSQILVRFTEFSIVGSDMAEELVRHHTMSTSEYTAIARQGLYYGACEKLWLPKNLELRVRARVKKLSRTHFW